MATNPGFGQRAREARRLWMAHHDEGLSYGRIGELVAERVARAEPYTHQAVRKWFALGQEPEYVVTAALADILEIDACWLAFGDGDRRGGEASPSVPIAPMPMRRVETDMPARRRRDRA